MRSDQAGEVAPVGTAADAAACARKRTVSGPGRTGRARPKVLLLCSGPEDHAIAFANGLSLHAETLLAVPRRQFAGLAHDLDGGVDLRWLDRPGHRRLDDPGFLVPLSRLIREERPDLIHLLSHTVFWLNAAIPFWRPIPLVVTAHDLERSPGEAWRVPGWSSRLAVRQAADVVVHGPRLRRHAERRFGKPRDRVHVLPHPAITRYARLADREGLKRRSGREGLTVLMFGRMSSSKGLSDLLQAESFIGDCIPGLRLIIAGRGDNPWSLRELMGDPSRYDIRNRFLPEREVAQIFLDADIVALPYRRASQSGVLHVAAAFGRPVIATDVGELGATVAKNGLGLVVAPGNPRRLADAMVTFAGNPQLLAACSDGARRWACGPASAEATGARAAALYRQIIGRHVPGPENASARRGNLAGGNPARERRHMRAGLP